MYVSTSVRWMHLSSINTQFIDAISLHSHTWKHRNIHSDVCMFFINSTIHLMYPGTEFDRSTFSFRSVQLFNNLSPSILQIKTLPVFRHAVFLMICQLTYLVLIVVCNLWLIFLLQRCVCRCHCNYLVFLLLL